MLSKRTTSTLSSTHFNAPRISNSKSSAVYHPSPDDFIGSFYAVLRRWQSETAFLSDPSEIRANPSFRAIVKNAHLVVQQIVSELKVKPSLLVWVLEEAVGVKPYPNHARGDIRAMSEAWIAWAERNGHTL